MRRKVNVADAERWASALGGAAMMAAGVQRMSRERPVAGAMLAAAASTLIYRGATGRCPVYSATGLSTADETSRRSLRGSSGVLVEEAVTINSTAEELYRRWRDFERLPQFMKYVVSVRVLDQRHSHWVARAPAGRTVEWDAEIIMDEPNRLIGWRTLSGSDVLSAGSVHFEPAGPKRGTAVRVRMQYELPAGRAGAALAWILGHEPSQTIREDLRRFKQLVETGEVPTTHGQAHGRRSALRAVAA